MVLKNWHKCKKNNSTDGAHSVHSFVVCLTTGLRQDYVSQRIPDPTAPFNIPYHIQPSISTRIGEQDGYRAVTRSMVTPDQMATPVSRQQPVSAWEPRQFEYRRPCYWSPGIIRDLLPVLFLAAVRLIHAESQVDPSSSVGTDLIEDHAAVIVGGFQSKRLSSLFRFCQFFGFTGGLTLDRG